MKKKTKMIVGIALAAMATSVLLAGCSGAALQADEAVQTRALTKMTLADTVNVTGTVESRESENVYSPLATLSVKNVYVSVGDKVSAGEKLCQLNTDTLQKDVEQSEAALDASQSVSQSQVNASQQQYDNAVNNLNNGLNPQVNSANAAVQNAQAANSRAESAYYTARDAAVQAKTVLDAAQAAYDADQSPENADALFAAQEAYNKAAQAEKTAASGTYDTQQALKSALVNQEIAVNAANQEIAAYKQALDSSRAAADSDSQEIGLEKLKMQLDEGVITAPISGTVTAVNAIEGASSTGVLFVIANPDDLKIETSVKEYDVNQVSPGLAATIQSDGTGDDVYDGVLRSIAPAASQSSADTGIAGTGASSSDVKFDAVVDVTSKNTGLRIGMNTRVDIILDQKEDVFAVPYDAVTQNAAGETVVYALVQDQNGESSFQEVPVFTGMETDFYIEISGKDLEEGMQIISNPDSVPALSLPSKS